MSTVSDFDQSVHDSVSDDCVPLAAVPTDYPPDAAEFLEWTHQFEAPITDADIDRMWAEEMERRERGAA